MADRIVNRGPVEPAFEDYSGFTRLDTLGEHRELAANDWAALAAVARDDHAANIFYRLGDGRNLELMGGTPTVHMLEEFGGTATAAERLGVPAPDLVPEIEQLVADSMVGGILEHPLATGTTYHERTTELVANMIEVAGGDDMRASDPARRAMAEISTPYSRDIAVASEGPDPLGNLPPNRLAGVDAGDVDRFMRELADNEAARVVMSRNAAGLVHDQIYEAAPDIAANRMEAFGIAERVSGAYYRELGEGWHDVQVDALQQREALVAGWRTLTDPVVDLVSGKIVERIPVVNTAADLPVVSSYVGTITNGLEERINSAVYDNLIPRPELESMTEWEQGIGEDVYTAVATGLHDHPDTRQLFVERAWVEDPVLYAEITSGNGEVTFEEFRRIPDVDNAISHYGDQVLQRIKTDMAYDQIFENTPG